MALEMRWSTMLGLATYCIRPSLAPSTRYSKMRLKPMSSRQHRVRLGSVHRGGRVLQVARGSRLAGVRRCLCGLTSGRAGQCYDDGPSHLV